MKKYSIVLSILFLITSISHGEDKDIIEMQKKHLQRNSKNI